MNINELKKMMEDTASSLEPNDDWLPALLLEKALAPDQKTVGFHDQIKVKKGTERGDVFIGLDPNFMKNENTKDACCQIMTKLIAGLEPDAVCFISTVWTVEPEPDETGILQALYEEGVFTPPSMDPKRVEAVMCMRIERGKYSEQEMVLGYIQRNPDKPPIITQWKEFEDPKLRSKGRFLDAIRNGFNGIGRKKYERRSKTKPNR